MLHQEIRDKMINITAAVKQATRINILWKHRECYIFLNYLKSKGCQVDFSEEEDNWAIVSLGEETLMYVWANYPLMFIKRNISLISFDKQMKDFVVVPVQTFKDEELCVDFEEVKDYFDYIENADKFSVVDLWFSTNSR